MKTLIGIYRNEYADVFTVIVNLNEADTTQTAFETAIQELKHLTGGDAVRSSNVSWYSAEMLNVCETVTYTLK